MRTAYALPLLSLALLAGCSARNDETPAATDTPGTAASGAADSAVGHPSQVAFERLRSRVNVPLAVKSGAITAGEAIDARFTNYGDNRSPPLEWSGMGGVRSYAVLLEDPDAKMPQPFVHWVAWNIPADVTSLAEGLPTDATLSQPDGMRQGTNGKDASGYFGPRPPAGDAPHHYHFEVFALDRTLDLPDDADRDALVEAMADHVVAKGELVATSEAPAGAS